ncbi:hypothetical protein K491DRAFT_655489 [Lophiostoma macrostomum CBS 122681]|uniref:FAD-binding FR-type domain-containing protein n=1 Tax=Lophiostoma macrostomum CBS 122681 TaxID=1314788 RepID=A0A6A6TDV5_9PLEO|nr:hypothetical protein K491DRAFT_655489 [Lophiostoma macrostomum CBS 122681]
MFGYEFVTLDEDQKHARRKLLEFYPVIAQWSALAILALFQLFFFVSWLAKRGLDYERPRSPSLIKRKDGKRTWLGSFQQTCEQARWWLKKPVIRDWGTRAEWIAGAVWTFWLLSLCVVQTGDGLDYLHLTKRFGIIAASQLPLHYLLAMRSPYSPVQLLTRMSHEELKAAHMVLGRIVFFLFVLHGIFYMNYFVLSGFLAKRIKDKDVIFGITALVSFWALNTTALGRLRSWNYRVFYVSHVAIATLIVVPLFLHVTHIRLYVYEIFVVYAVHVVLRSLSLDVYSGSISVLPGTNLIRIRIPLTGKHSALKWKPGQHVYLSRPSGKSYSTLYDQFVLRNKTNPFTIASIPSKDQELVLVARTLNGNTKHLAQLARSLTMAGSDDVATIPLGLEGPYGASARLPDFARFDKILLIAGGVGATFVMPIYRSILEAGDSSHPLRFIWATRKLSETQWAFPMVDDDEPAMESPTHAVEVFVTQPVGPDLQVSEAAEDVELAEDDQLLSMEEQMEKPRRGVLLRAGRPQIRAIIDEECSKASKVAVIACGPKAITTTVSDSVERWVSRGLDVYWHDETFGW